MKLQTRYNGNYQFDILDHEKEWAKKRLVKDKLYTIEVKTKRSSAQHNYYWLVLGALAFHFGGTDADWHYELKKKFMRPRLVTTPKGETFEFPPSESFNRCTQIEMNEYFGKVQDWVAEQGYLVEELIETANS